MLAIIVGILILFVSGYFSQSVNLYTTSLAKEYTENVLNETLSKEVLESISDGITKQVTNSSGSIVYSYVDAYKVNLLRTTVSENISKTIKTINDHEDFDDIFIPFGYLISKNYFLSNGIKVPVNLEVISNHKVDIEASVIEYGINSSVIEIYLKISLDVLVAIPFQREAVTSVCKIPLSIEIINSDVPKYYFTGSDGVPTLILGEDN